MRRKDDQGCKRHTWTDAAGLPVRMIGARAIVQDTALPRTC
jgi:hypothetical protein